MHGYLTPRGRADRALRAAFGMVYGLDYLLGGGDDDDIPSADPIGGSEKQAAATAS